MRRLITEDIPGKVVADKAYRNGQKNNDGQNAGSSTIRRSSG